VAGGLPTRGWHVEPTVSPTIRVLVRLPEIHGFRATGPRSQGTIHRLNDDSPHAGLAPPSGGRLRPKRRGCSPRTGNLARRGAAGAPPAAVAPDACRNGGQGGARRRARARASPNLRQSQVESESLAKAIGIRTRSATAIRDPHQDAIFGSFMRNSRWESRPERGGGNRDLTAAPRYARPRELLSVDTVCVFDVLTLADFLPAWIRGSAGNRTLELSEIAADLKTAGLEGPPNA